VSETDRVNSRSALRKLSSWHWPGNVRELENFIERSVILTHGTALRAPTAEFGHSVRNAPGTYEANDRDEIVRILKVTSGRVASPDGRGTHGDQTNDADLAHEEVGHRSAQSNVTLDQAGLLE